MVKALIRKTVRLYVADRLVQFGQASRPWWQRRDRQGKSAHSGWRL